MSKPQAGIKSISSAIEDVELRQSEIQQAIEALDMASAIYYDPETPPEWQPWLSQTISRTDAAIKSAQAGNTQVNLESFKDIETLLQSGFQRDQRQRQTDTLVQSLDLATEDIDTQLESEVLNEQARQQLERERDVLEAQQTAIREPVQALITAERQLEQTRASIRDRLPTNAEEIQLNKAIFLAERNKIQKQNPEFTLEEASELATQRIEPLLERIMIDPSGDLLTTRYVFPPSEGVDFRTGQILDKETGQFREAPTWELFIEAVKPQILGTREGFAQGEPRFKFDPTIQETYETFKDVGETIVDTTLMPIAPAVGLVKSLQPEVVSTGTQDILVESPTMAGFRFIGSVPSAVTALVADGLTYTVDDNGNPIDPEDFSYKLNQLGIMAPYREYAPWAHGFQAVESDRDWLNATTTRNRVLSAISEGGFVIELKQSIPAWNVDLDSQYWQNKPDVMKYGAYMADTYLGASALVTDLIMPLGPGKYTGALAKALRPVAKYGPPGALAYALNLEKEFDVIYKMVEDFRIGNPIVGYNTKAAQRAYRAELNEVIDEAFEGSVTPIRDVTINNMQNTVARETAEELTNLQMWRLTQNPEYIRAGRLPDKAYIDYAQWIGTRTSIDNPLRVPISIADELLFEARAMRNLKRGQTLPTVKLYSSAFRSNLVRAGVKRPAYKNRLLDTYATRDANQLPEPYYHVLAKDDEVLFEAMNKTIKDALKDDLYSRLPVDQIMVGTNRIVNISQFSDANRKAVAKVYGELTDFEKLPNGLFKLKGADNASISAIREKRIEAFINGIGVDEIRQSQPLKDLLVKINNDLPLTPEEFTVFRQSVIDHAWDTVVTESRAPLLMSESAYIEAAELSHNSVNRARSAIRSREYVASIRAQAAKDSAYARVVSIFSPASVIKARKKLIDAGMVNSTKRAYLSSLLISDFDVSKTVIPFLELKRKIDFLKSTSFDNLVNDIKLYMTEAKRSKDATTNSNPGLYALNRLILDASEEQIRIEQRLIQNRYEREYAYLSKSMSRDEALELAWNRTIAQLKDSKRYNSNLSGVDVKKIGIDDLVEITIPNAVREATLYKLSMDFTQNFWYVGASSVETTAAKYTQIVRESVKDLMKQSPNATLRTDFLQEMVAKLNAQPELAALNDFQIVSTKNDELWAESFTLFVLSLRGQTVMKSGINEMMIRYPSLYTDLVLTPLQRLNRITDKTILQQQAIDQIQDVLKPGPLKDIFSQLKADVDLQEFFTLLNAGTPLKTIQTNHSAAFNARNRFQNQIEGLLFEEGRKQNLTGQALDDFVNAKQKSVGNIVTGNRSRKELAFLYTRDLLKSYEVSAARALQLSSRDIGKYSADMIQGIVLNNLSMSKAAPNELWKLTYIANKDGSLKLAAESMNAATFRLVKLFENPNAIGRTTTEMYRLGVSNTFGLSGAYSGNLNDLIIQMGAKSGFDNIPKVDPAIPTLGILEKEITSVLNSYGIRFLPFENVDDAARVINNFRPRLQTMDTQGIAMFLGRDMARDWAKIKQMADGVQWKQVLDNYRSIIAAHKKPAGITRYRFNYYVTNSFDIMQRIVHTGLLGGMGPRPNLRYLAVNVISAPIIMAVELGTLGALKSIGWLGADFKFLAGKWNPDDVYMVTQNGEQILYRDYTRMLREQNIATTFSAAQFHSTSISELIRGLEVTSDLSKASKFREIYRWYLDPSKRTRFTMWAHHSDMSLRRAAFSNALFDGYRPSTAAALSRRALLDYGQARNTPVARAMGNNIAFWSFQWESLKSVSRSLWFGRGDALRIARTHEGYNKQQETYFVGNSKEHARMFRYLIETGDEKQILSGGFYNPAYESLSILTEGMAMAIGLTYNSIYDKKIGDNAAMQIKEAVTARSPFMPIYVEFYNFFLKQAPGYNPYDTQRFLPPMYISSMNKDNIFRERMIQYFDLEQVQPRPGDPTYNGMSYKFGTVEGADAFTSFESILLGTAIQRGLKDSLKTAMISSQGIVPETILAGSDTLSFDRGYYSAVQDQLVELGIESPMGNHIAAILAYELAIATPLRQDTPEVLFIREEIRRAKAKYPIKQKQ